MNKAVLTGRITRDPELRYTPNGKANLLFTLAVDRQTKDDSGNRQTDFISCVAWGQQADFMSRYVRKGNMLAIVGRIQARSYQGQDNQTHYITEVVVESLENLSPRDPNQVQQQGGFQQQGFQQQGFQQTGYQQPTNNFQQPQGNPYQGYNNPTYGQPQQANNSLPNGSNDAPKSFDVNIDDEEVPF